MIEGLASASSVMFKGFRSALRTEPQIPFTEWTEKHGRNPDGGRFQFLNYQLAPASDLFDDRFEYIAFRWFSGAGKTYLTAMSYAFAIDQLKLNLAKIFPAKDEAKEWFEDELTPILDATPKIAKLRKVKDNTFLKKWVNGASIKGRGFRSPGSLRTLKVNITDSDEIDAIERTKKDEGNPLTIAERRTRNQHFQAHWRTSYPSVKGQSLIDNSIDRSDFCKWYFDCPCCKVTVYWERKHVTWETGKESEARVKCPECKKKFTDAQRLKSCESTGRWINRDGETIEPGTPPNPKYGNRRGYHLNCMAFQLPHDGAYENYLHELAAKQEAANSADDPTGEEQVIINTFDAESYVDVLAEKPEPSDLFEARVHWDGEELPEDVVAIYLGADPNQTFQAIHVLGIGEDKVYPLLYEKVLGWWERPSSWIRLLDIVRRKRWKHPSGVSLRVNLSCWDSKFQRDTVYKYAKQCPRVICTKGSSVKDAPPIADIITNRKQGIRTMVTGPNYLKATVYDWVAPPKLAEDTPEQERHLVEVEFSDVKDADGWEMFSEEYFEGLLSEDRGSELYKGKMVPIFLHPSGAPRNEPLDTFALAVAAMKADRFNYAKARASLDAKIEQLKPENRPQPTPQTNYLGNIGKDWI